MKRLALGVGLASAATLGAVAYGVSTAPSVETGDVTIVNGPGWACRQPVRLDTVQVVGAVSAGGNPQPGVRLQAGCTGSIRYLVVDQASDTPVEVGQDAHDLTISHGSLTCVGRVGRRHEDGIHARSGTNIVFDDVTIRCPTATGSAFFVSQGRTASSPPTRVICAGCDLAGGTYTVNIATGDGSSGVRDSILHKGKYGWLRPHGAAIDTRNIRAAAIP